MCHISSRDPNKGRTQRLESQKNGLTVKGVFQGTINCVLISHEDHIVYNLDETGRLLLNARHVLTTIDGARKLAPRPSVQGKKA
jgi:hypothetical protein